MPDCSSFDDQIAVVTGGARGIGKVIRFLASDEASYITGTTVHIDGGLTARRAG